MRSFTDTEGRSWDLALTIASIKQVKDLTEINLLEPLEGEPPLINRLATDFMLLVDVIWALIKGQADPRGVDEMAFAAALGPDRIAAAYEAFFAEYEDFFRQVGRTDVAMALAKQTELIKRIVGLAQKRIESGEIEDRLAREFPEMKLRPESGEAPEPSASTPAD